MANSNQKQIITSLQNQLEEAYARIEELSASARNEGKVRSYADTYYTQTADNVKQVKQLVVKESFSVEQAEQILAEAKENGVCWVRSSHKPAGEGAFTSTNSYCDIGVAVNAWNDMQGLTNASTEENIAF